METTLFPTKSNLLNAKNTLELSKQGYDLMDTKRNILILELMELIEAAKDLQKEINTAFEEAHTALKQALIVHGSGFIERAGGAVLIEDCISVKLRSVMGAQIPEVDYRPEPLQDVPYSLHSTSALVDQVRSRFEQAKKLTIQLAMVENAAYRLAVNISKTQKRANALHNIVIPRYEGLITYISSYLEEKEREDFGRLKVIKRKTKK